MTDDRDPGLQKLFDTAGQDIAPDAFTKDVMSEIDGLRRRAIIAWSLVGLALIPCMWLISVPVLDATHLLTEILPKNLIEVDDQLMAQLLSPVNSIAGLFGLGLLGVRAAMKKIFR